MSCSTFKKNEIIHSFCETGIWRLATIVEINNNMDNSRFVNVTVAYHGCLMWVTFVSNRVSAILEVIQRKDWYHVKAEDNPADLVSRGCHPGELVSDDKWWFGPKEIRQKEFEVPNPDHLVTKETVLEMKKETSHCFFANEPEPAGVEVFQCLKKASKLEKHVRITAHILRFLSRF